MVQIGRESGEVDVESDRMGEERRGGGDRREGGVVVAAVEGWINFYLFPHLHPEELDLEGVVCRERGLIVLTI